MQPKPQDVSRSRASTDGLPTPAQVDVLRQILIAFRAGMTQPVFSDVHTQATAVATIDLLGGAAPGDGLFRFATENPNTWGNLASIVAFGAPLGPLERLPRSIRRWILAYDYARRRLALAGDV